MTTKEMIKAFEAVLFASGEPLSIDRFTQVFEITPEKTVEVMEALAKKYEENDGGLKLVRLENTYQIATKTEYADYIKKAFDIRRRTPLSSAALEVLAVVAYNQPVTKSFIEQVRGVDCSSVVTTLIEKGLVEDGFVDLYGVCRLKVSERGPQRVLNPRTGEPMTTATRKRLRALIARPLRLRLEGKDHELEA